MSQIWPDTVPSCAGRKKWNKTEKCNQHIIETKSHTPNSRSKQSILDVNNFHDVFVKYTKTTTCYGYKWKFRHSENYPSLPLHFGILLARKEYSIYSLAGSPVVKIRKFENVYLDVGKAWVNRAKVPFLDHKP